VVTWACTSCGADWSGGDFTPRCDECGGGAMQRSCLLCDGRCGAVYERAPLDSVDFHMAHWIGACLLSKEKQQAWLTTRRAEVGKNDE